MSKITEADVIAAFAESKACAGAEDCKKAAEAMCKFFAFDNQETQRIEEGMITFYVRPVDPCPNRDQLFCQDQAELA